MTDFTGFAEKFGALAAREGFSLTPGQTQQFARYAELLEEWNQKMNLTAIRAPEEVAVKHFIDSLLLLRALPLGGAQRVIDVGTGAGFPGVPLLIARPGIALTLLDSLQKRLRFLEEACAQLGLHAKTVHARAEEAGRNPALRGQFDLATARAVAPLPVLCEYCLPFVKQGGFFAALKGPGAREELEAANRAVRLLGARLAEVREDSLPDGSGRTLLFFEKCGPTPAKYPRHGAKIAKDPL